MTTIETVIYLMLLVNMVIWGMTIYKETNGRHILLNLVNMITIGLIMIKTLMYGENIALAVVCGIAIVLNLVSMICHFMFWHLTMRTNKEVEIRDSLHKTKETLKQSMYLMEKYKK